VPKADVSKRRICAVASCIAAVVAVALLVLFPISHRAAHATSPSSETSRAASQSTITPAARERLQATFAALPLAFEQNQGQTDPQVKYMARANGYTLFLTNHNAVFAFHSKSSGSGLAARRHARSSISNNAAVAQEKPDSVVRMQIAGENPAAQIAAVNQLPGRTNYYIGNDPKKWHSNVPQYSRVAYKNVYPGIDLAYYGEQSKLEFDFIVAPESDPAPIGLAFSGAEHVSADASGNLVVSSASGDVVLHKPVAYQQQNGERQLVEARFVLKSNNQVGFQLGEYDHSRELVIDPTLTYGTYLGGAEEDEVFAIALDPSNNVYVTGESNSTSGWPTAAAGNVPASHSFDVFVTKLTSAGVMSYTTFVGGANADSGLAIAVDSTGEAFVTGITQSSNFPTTAGVAQATTTNSSPCVNTKNNGTTACSDAFALKLSAGGAISWATFVGGNNDDDGYGIALDSTGNVWVAGDTFSSSFYPLTAATTTLNTTFNYQGTLNPPANDGFVVELNPAATSFLYATYLGGEFSDQINGIVIDSTNDIYVAGETNSANFPTTVGAYQTTCGSDGKCNVTAGGTAYYDAFVTKLAPGGTAITYSTFVGGSSDDYAYALALDSSGDVYITGSTTSDDTTTTPAVPYPTTKGAFGTTYNAGAGGSNGFVTELNSSGSSLVYSTFLGGSVADFGGGIAVDNLGDTYVTGMTTSPNFPVTSNATQSLLNGGGTTTTNSDAFVSQVLPGGASLGFSTYLGGSGDENANASGAVGAIALDSSLNMWVAGSTNSATVNSFTNFPVTANAAQPTFGGSPYDGFVAEISSAAVPDFNISASTPATVAPGASGSSTVTLTSLFGYNSPVNLTCAVTGTGSPLPACSTTSFGTNPVTPTASGATSTLTITTTGSSAVMVRPSKFFYAMWLPIAGMALVGMGFSSARTRRKKLLGFLMIGMVMAALFLMPACDGGSTSSTPPPNGCSGCTPAGSYTVTITGAGTDAATTTHSTTVTLTVN
jgi:hypothetical protein